MSEIIIRDATESDLDSLLSLLGQPDMCDGDVPLKEDARTFFQAINATTNHKIYVAEYRGEIVGTFALVTIQHLSHSGARSVIVEDVVVRSDMQGQGIGKKMTEFATQKASDSGAYKIALTSGLAREAAHRFYEAHGFKKHGFSFLLQT